MLSNCESKIYDIQKSLKCCQKNLNSVKARVRIKSEMILRQNKLGCCPCQSHTASKAIAYRSRATYTYPKALMLDWLKVLCKDKDLYLQNVNVE